MRALLLILIASTALGQGRFDRFNQRTDQGRSTRGFEQSNYAFFELAPASGAGMGTACACAAITGAKGETVTLTRASDATCAKQGTATTGIANGDLVVCTANQPRIESVSGELRIRLEAAKTNALPRFIDYTNAAWADVGTPTPTTGQTSPWTGALSTSAVQFDDNDGAAFEGRTQTVTVTAATAYTMSCYVKAGTLTSARLSLDGTTADFTGLSSTTWSLVSVTDASSSGVAIAAQILNGSTAAATGTVIWGGCQVEVGAATSMQPTVAAAVARNADAPPWFSVVPSSVASGSMSARVVLFATAANGLLSAEATTAFQQSIITFGGERAYVGGVSLVGPLVALAAGQHDVAMWWTNSSTNLILNGSQTSGAAGSPVATDRLLVGGYGGGNLEPGLYSRVCYDPSPSRCTP